jgi:hypothetical protein
LINRATATHDAGLSSADPSRQPTVNTSPKPPESGNDNGFRANALAIGRRSEARRHIDADRADQHPED